MKLIVLKRAEKQILKLPKIVLLGLREQTLALIEGRETNEKKLKGYPSFFRLRIGNYRAVYERKDGNIYLILIQHRKDVYQSLERIFK